MAIRGVITKIIRPLFGAYQPDLAASSLQLDEPGGAGNWKTLTKVCHSTDFILQTPAGELLIESSSDKPVVGKHFEPTPTQLRDLLAANRLPVEYNHRLLKPKLWELRLGDSIEIACKPRENRLLSVKVVGSALTAQTVTTIHNLKPGKGNYCIYGRIVLIHQPLLDDFEHPLAVLRLGIQVKDEVGHWSDMLVEPLSSFSDFCIEDGTGRAWVRRHPAITDGQVSLLKLTPKNIDDRLTGQLLTLLGQVQLPGGRPYRNEAWQVRLGDRVTVCGEVSDRVITTYTPSAFRRA